MFCPFLLIRLILNLTIPLKFIVSRRYKGDKFFNVTFSKEQSVLSSPKLSQLHSLDFWISRNNSARKMDAFFRNFHSCSVIFHSRSQNSIGYTCDRKSYFELRFFD